MALRTVSTLKFVGTISLGLFTGLSYSLSSLTIPTLLTLPALPSANSASQAFSYLATSSLAHLRGLAAVSSTSFCIAYFLSPRSQKHPYLLWTSLFVAVSGATDLIMPASKKVGSTVRTQKEKVKAKAKGRQMDASYEVLGASDRDSEGSASGEEVEEDINREEVKQEMEGFQWTQAVRTAIASVGFAMSVVGIWGDGVSQVDTVLIEM